MRLFLSMGVGVDGAVKHVSKGNTEEYRFINQYLKIEIYDLMFYSKFNQLFKNGIRKYKAYTFNKFYFKENMIGLF